MRRLPTETFWVAVRNRTREVLINLRLRLPFRANFVGAIDGDTIMIRPQASWGKSIRKPLRIRLAAVDAPEIDQRGWVTARNALDEHLRGSALLIVPTDVDIYGRIVAYVRSKEGWACFSLAASGKAHPETWLTRLLSIPAAIKGRGVHGPDRSIHPREWRRGERDS